MNKYLILVFAALMVAACVTVSYEAKPQQIDDQSIPAFDVKGSVDVEGMRESRFKMVYESTSQLNVDYKRIADTAVAMLASELAKRSSPISGAEKKSLGIQVDDVTMFGIFQCFINFTIETGDGYRRGLQAYGKNWNFMKACDGAMPDMVIQIVSDPNVQEYLAS